ncbi:peptide chain release factor N(5)-glutamine methyltransferase [Rhodohalobacter halophilus]|uniref:peptide chain release factor N(5)-glutamine methyltransferase n=1 Tax=Rhodohalobacter halophilus TaxID=1812810 RepID=UPI00083F9BCC|nr:peptide chain release factor N(5)-glutamine methyltransferase [Rhodohalobacter halophilus]
MSSNPDKVWTVLSMLEWATDFFEEKGVDNPRLSIEWLLAHILDIRRLDLYLKFDRPLSPDELDRLRPLVKRRAAHEPLQYITGTTDFLNCTIQVSKEVLIPRPETEQLVEMVLNRYDSAEELSVLDIGTGSGCIPVAIKKNRPNWICAGLDISDDALHVAQSNAELNDVDVSFFKGDLNRLESKGKTQEQEWDIIISNPPYITNEEKVELDPQVLNYEPELALFHDKPLEVYQHICKFAASQQAVLYLECNDKIAEQIKDVALQFFGKAELKKDYDQNNRFVVAE